MQLVPYSLVRLNPKLVGGARFAVVVSVHGCVVCSPVGSSRRMCYNRRTTIACVKDGAPNELSHVRSHSHPTDPAGRMTRITGGFGTTILDVVLRICACGASSPTRSIHVSQRLSGRVSQLADATAYPCTQPKLDAAGHHAIAA